MDNDLCCPVCKDLFDDKGKTPRNLGCGHSLCSVCLEKLLRKNPFCPECRKRFSGSQLNDFTINYPLLRLACSARNLEKDLTSENSSTTKLSNSRKNVGDCTSHGCSLFFWCSHHCVWVCRDCLVLDHQRPPHGSCQIVAAEDAIDIVKKIQVEKIVSKFKELELLKTMITDELKYTEDKRRKCNDSFDSSMDNYKKYLSNVGIFKSTLSKLKYELNSDLIFDNVVKMVKSATEILDNLAQSIVECRKIMEQTSCKTTIQDTAFFMFENNAEVTDNAVTQNQLQTIQTELTQAQNIIQELREQASADSNLETTKSELIAAHLQIKEFKKQTKAQEDMHREINKYIHQLTKKSLEIDSLRQDISGRSIQQLSLENQLKSLKLDKNYLNQKINKLNEDKLLSQRNYDKEILNLKENQLILENLFKNHQVTGNYELSVLQDQLKKANIEINALEMRLKDSVKHQNSLIKKIENSDAK